MRCGERQKKPPPFHANSMSGTSLEKNHHLKTSLNFAMCDSRIQPLTTCVSTLFPTHSRNNTMQKIHGKTPRLPHQNKRVDSRMVSAVLLLPQVSPLARAVLPPY